MDNDTNMAPGAELDDGMVTIVYCKRGSKGKLIAGFLEAETGDHVKRPEVNMVKTRAYRLKANSTSRFAVDGELVVDRDSNWSMQSEVYPGVARVFHLPW
jgi:diacylglycerol kinase family enzyme